MILKANFVTVENEVAMRQQGYEDFTVILALEESKFYRYNRLTQTFVPLTITTNVTNVTNSSVGLTEDEALALFTPTTDYLYELIQRILIQDSLNKIPIKDPVLLNELEIAFKTINL